MRIILLDMNLILCLQWFTFIHFELMLHLRKSQVKKLKIESKKNINKSDVKLI